MTQKFAREEFDVYVWEGTSDIASRAERCLAGMDVSLVRADAGTAFRRRAIRRGRRWRWYRSRSWATTASAATTGCRARRCR